MREEHRTDLRSHQVMIIAPRGMNRQAKEELWQVIEKNRDTIVAHRESRSADALEIESGAFKLMITNSTIEVKRR